MRVKTTLHFEINSLLLISLNLNRARNMKNNQTYKSFTWSASKAVNASSPSDVLQDKMQTGHLASLEEGSSVRSFSDNKSLLLIATITLFKAGSSSPLWSSTSLDTDSWSGCMSCAGGDELFFVSRNCPLFMYSVFGELWSKFCKVVAGMPRQTIWSSIYSDHSEWGDLVLMTFVASIINTLRSAFCALKGKECHMNKNDAYYSYNNASNKYAHCRIKRWKKKPTKSLKRTMQSNLFFSISRN